MGKAKGKAKDKAKGKAKPGRMEIGGETAAPRGYGSERNAAAVAEASAIVRKLYPKIDTAQYLAEVGAGRFLALHRYAG